MCPVTLDIKSEVKSENDVIDLTSPLPKTHQKCPQMRQPLIDASQEVIDISSSLEAEAPLKKIKLEIKVVVKENAKLEDTARQVAIMRQLKVTKVEYMDKIPWCWLVLEERVAYVLDLSGKDCDWVDSKGKQSAWIGLFMSM